MARSWFEGWTGVLVTAGVGVVVTGGALAALLLATKDDVPLDRRVFDEPGAVALPGQLECELQGARAPTPVPGPSAPTAAVAVSGGDVLVAGEDGLLWRGDPETGLEPWDESALDGVTALGRSPLPDHVFAAASQGLVALDLGTGEVLSRQPLAPDTAVVGVAASNRRVYVLTAEGDVLQAEWAYEVLRELEPVEADEPLPPLTSALVSPDGQVLLGARTEGPLLRLSLVNGRQQDVPVGEDVDAASMTLGPGGLVYLTDGRDLRVLDLNERWVTGRLSTPVEGWDARATHVAASQDGLLVVGSHPPLALAPYPQCNREELTRLEAPAG